MKIYSITKLSNYQILCKGALPPLQQEQTSGKFRHTDYGSITVNSPGLTIWITPPQLHISFDWSLSAGMLPIRTVGDPGTHGAVVTGTQGMGVKTPRAAAVAAATVGFDGELHMPNGGIFTMGALSIMVAAGGPPAIT